MSLAFERDSRHCDCEVGQASSISRSILSFLARRMRRRRSVSDCLRITLPATTSLEFEGEEWLSWPVSVSTGASRRVDGCLLSFLAPCISTRHELFLLAVFCTKVPTRFDTRLFD